MSDLEELEMIETTLGSFESPLDSFYLSLDFDEGFRLFRSRDSRIFQVNKNEIDFRDREKLHTCFEVPKVSPPMFLSKAFL